LTQQKKRTKKNKGVRVEVRWGCSMRGDINCTASKFMDLTQCPNQ